MEGHRLRAMLIVILSTCIGGLKSEGSARNYRVRRDLFSQALQDDIVNYHNNLRRMEGASNMEYMLWDDDLASLADQWAEGCIFAHGQPSGVTSPFDPVGQNLFYTNSAQPNPLDGIQDWYNEKDDYEFDTLFCKTPPCGHYTQVVWASSKYIGCAFKDCQTILNGTNNVIGTSAYYLVCNYGPGGNYVGQPPYIKGDECTQCQSGSSWCNDGLCVDLDNPGTDAIECKANCQNCGTRVSTDTECSCECQVGWTGTDCSDVCQNMDSRCGNGYPASFCETQPYVLEMCPVLCGLCEAGESVCNQTTTEASTTESDAVVMTTDDITTDMTTPTTETTTTTTTATPATVATDLVRSIASSTTGSQSFSTSGNRVTAATSQPVFGSRASTTPASQFSTRSIR